MFGRLLLISGVGVLLSIDSLIAQTPDTLWTKRFGGWGEDYGACVVQTGNDGFILTGSTMPFGPDSSADLFLVKTDNDGNQLWTRTYGDSGTLWDCGRHICQTSDGGYIIVGETESYGGGQIEYPDIYLLKIDSGGSQEWYRTFGGPGMDIGYWVEPTMDGGFIIAGELDNCGDLVLIKTDSLGFDVWTRTFGAGCSVGFCVRQTRDGGYIVSGVDYTLIDPYYCGYLLKIDSLGNEEWSRRYEEYDAKVINCVEQTLDDGYILTGVIGDGNNFDTSLKKLSAAGDTVWTRYFANARWDLAYCVQQTSDSGFVVCGSNDARTMGSFDVYIFKTDIDGELEWELTLGEDQNDFAKCIQQTSDGGFICCGSTQSIVDPSDRDIWLIRIAAEGTPIGEPDIITPNRFTLNAPFPNPFNSATTISYTLPAPGPVTFDIYDILGRKVATLFTGIQPAGAHRVAWDAKEMPSGLYFCRLTADNYSGTMIATLLK